MRGIADDMDATRAHVLRGDVSHTYARSQVERGQRWLEGLGTRRNHPGFVEEAEEVVRAIAKLCQAIDARWPDYVRLLYIPARDTGMKHLETPEVAVNAAAALHLRQAGATEVQLQRNVIPSRPLMKKSVEVRRYDQGWVQRTRRKRARVEVAYELVIGGQHVLMGSKRYVMRQADWAAMCDANGQLPELERLTGLAKRRALYKARKARRTAAADRVRKRERFKRRIPNWIRKLGGAMADSIWKSLMRPSIFEKMVFRMEDLDPRPLLATARIVKSPPFWSAKTADK